MKSLEWYLKYIQRFDPLSVEEEKLTMLKAKQGSASAREKILNHNLRFVVSVAKKYQNQGMPLEDLISEGNRGLVKAYEKFDISKQVRFITYAV